MRTRNACSFPTPARAPAIRRNAGSRVRRPREAALSRVAQAQCPRAKMAARRSAPLVAGGCGDPRLPAAAGRARPPAGGVVGASLGRNLSVTTFLFLGGSRSRGAADIETRCQLLSEGENQRQGLERVTCSLQLRCWDRVIIFKPHCRNARGGGPTEAEGRSLPAVKEGRAAVGLRRRDRQLRRP